MIGRPRWWFWVYLAGVLLAWIPLVGLFLGIAVFVLYLLGCLDMAKSFGRGGGTGIGLWLLPFVFAPMLGFGDAQYVGPAAAVAGPYGGPTPPPPGGYGVPPAPPAPPAAPFAPVVPTTPATPECSGHVRRDDCRSERAGDAARHCGRRRPDRRARPHAAGARSAAGATGRLAASSAAARLRRARTRVIREGPGLHRSPGPSPSQPAVGVIPAPAAFLISAPRAVTP